MENGKERNEIRFLDIHSLISIPSYSHIRSEDRMVTILKNREEPTIDTQMLGMSMGCLFP
jgi:hypothetical protein